MDRRSAVKKLAAGGAIAAGSSVVLSSNGVAFAASCVVDITNPVATLAGDTGGQNNPYWLITNTTAAPPGVTANFVWRIRSYANLTGRRGNFPRLKVNPDGIAALVGPDDDSFVGNVATPSSGVASSAVISRTNSNGGPTRGFQPDDDYVVQLDITWDGACDTTLASFEISPSGSGQAQPTVTRIA